jgi:TDG/mug DNA glycosylase family protein
MSVLPDILAPDLAVVFCGTAAGTVSAARGAYYAGPGNAFWHTLFETGLTPRRLEASQFRSVIEYRLGLTDLAKEVSGSDDVLLPEHFGHRELREKIHRYQPRVLAFTSKRAAQEYLGRPVAYGLADEMIGPTRLFVLPSPSGAARRYWDLAPWRDLSDLRKSPS